MSKLKLKDEYKGLIITRGHISVGKITFDSTTVDPINYHNYAGLGFEDIFDVEEEIISEKDKLDKVKDEVKNYAKNNKKK